LTWVGIIDVSGVIFGMGSLADELISRKLDIADVVDVEKLTAPDGAVHGAPYAFLAASVGTMVSAISGGTPLIVYVESAGMLMMTMLLKMILMCDDDVISLKLCYRDKFCYIT